jgi:hypothetical protein
LPLYVFVLVQSGAFVSHVEFERGFSGMIFKSLFHELTKLFSTSFQSTFKMAKTPSKQSAKAPKKATTGGKRSKKRTESYSSYIYKVLKQVRQQTTERS